MQEHVARNVCLSGAKRTFYQLLAAAEGPGNWKGQKAQTAKVQMCHQKCIWLHQRVLGRWWH